MSLRDVRSQRSPTTPRTSSEVSSHEADDGRLPSLELHSPTSQGEEVPGTQSKFREGGWVQPLVPVVESVSAVVRDLEQQLVDGLGRDDLAARRDNGFEIEELEHVGGARHRRRAEPEQGIRACRERAGHLTLFSPPHRSS
jgi:hypothetical protein